MLQLYATYGILMADGRKSPAGVDELNALKAAHRSS